MPLMFGLLINTVEHMYFQSLNFKFYELFNSLMLLIFFSPSLIKLNKYLQWFSGFVLITRKYLLSFFLLQRKYLLQSTIDDVLMSSKSSGFEIDNYLILKCQYFVFYSLRVLCQYTDLIMALKLFRVYQSWVNHWWCKHSKVMHVFIL